MAPKRKRKDEGLLSRLPSNPYACKRGSREEKEKAIWCMANVSQYIHARACALQAHMPNPDNLFPKGKRRFSKKAIKAEEEWLVEEAKRQSLKAAGSSSGTGSSGGAAGSSGP